MIKIERTDPLSPDALALIAGSEAELSALYPPEERFAFSPDQLVTAKVRFFMAKLDDVSAGCCGFAVYDGYAELKRMFVQPEARGKGVSSALLNAVEAAARAEGIGVMRLETGTASPAAIGLYTRHGYRKRAPFGDYEDIASSVFMEKTL